MRRPRNRSLPRRTRSSSRQGGCTRAGRRLPASPSETATATPQVAAATSEASAGGCEPATRQRASTPVRRSSSRQVACTWQGGGPPPFLRCRPRGAAPRRRRRGARRRSQDACGPDRPAPRPAGPRSQPVPVPRLQLRHCDAHHVVHWADGGETRLQNLVLCCRFHHRAVHEEGFQVVADAAGQFRFLRPDGVPLPAEPPAACWEGAPLAPTDARLAAAGVSIGPHTATPIGTGKRWT